MNDMTFVTDAELADACAALRRGEVIGLPTETVYGLAGDARNVEAVRRIFSIKGRPADHPLIVHLADASELGSWTREVPDLALKLAAAFWPGPLTMILKRAGHVSDLVTGGQDTIGVRVPNHPVALALLRMFGSGLAAPSANRFGHVSPTTAAHVRDEFGDAVPIVLDGGPCKVGIESTIVDLSGTTVRILRPGQIGADRIAEVLGEPVAVGTQPASPRVSGSLASHYAPDTPAERVPTDQLDTLIRQALGSGESVRVLALRHLPDGVHGLVMPNDPEQYARHLYAALRSLDAEGAERLMIETPPDDPRWLAIHDRIARATVAPCDDDAP
ncbi:MAG TPA: L-threonylcarbamoyladenylate synthase [Patescibacteria group bacterium]|nr:L-threonylcarbamoyladenylate synthase [Patescibacteria group bacterium]